MSDALMQEENFNLGKLKRNLAKQNLLKVKKKLPKVNLNQHIYNSIVFNKYYLSLFYNLKMLVPLILFITPTVPERKREGIN